MSAMPHGTMTGGLHGWRSPDGVRQLLATEGVTSHSVPAAGWRLLVYQSSVPLITVPNLETGPTQYQFLLRVSGAHAVLVASEGNLVDAFLRAARVTAGMFMPRVFVDEIVNKLATEPDDRFVLGGVYARVDGYGNSLRTIALWGADVADTQLFQSIRGNLGPYRIDLRDVKRGVPLLSISSRGELSFNFDGPNSLLDVTATIETLSKEGYLAWPL